MTERRISRPSWLVPAAVAAGAGIVLLAVAPFASDYVLHVLITSLYYTILAASWNLLAGFTGQFSLAQQAFAAIGAYGSGLLTPIYGLPPSPRIVCGVAIAAPPRFRLRRLALRLPAISL